MILKKMTTDQMITMAQSALNQDLVKLEAQSDAALKVFMDTEAKLNAVNDSLAVDIEKLEAMEHALAERRHQAEKLLAKALFMAEYNLTPNWLIAESHRFKEGK